MAGWPHRALSRGDRHRERTEDEEITDDTGERNRCERISLGPFGGRWRSHVGSRGIIAHLDPACRHPGGMGWLTQFSHLCLSNYPITWNWIASGASQWSLRLLSDLIISPPSVERLTGTATPSVSARNIARFHKSQIERRERQVPSQDTKARAPQTSQPLSGSATRPLSSLRTTWPVSPPVAPRRTLGPTQRGQISRPAVERRRVLRGTFSECAPGRIFVRERHHRRLEGAGASLVDLPALCGMWGGENDPRHGPAGPSSAALSVASPQSPQFTPLLRLVIPARALRPTPLTL